MIKHIVMWKFKNEEKEKMKIFLGRLEALKETIPEIQNLETGININPKNEYDAILISEFKNMEELEIYKKHPKHVEVSNFCKEIRIARQSIDYEF